MLRGSEKLYATIPPFSDRSKNIPALLIEICKSQMVSNLVSNFFCLLRYVKVKWSQIFRMGQSSTQPSLSYIQYNTHELYYERRIFHSSENEVKLNNFGNLVNAQLATMSSQARWRYQARNHLEHMFW